MKQLILHWLKENTQVTTLVYKDVVQKTTTKRIIVLKDIEVVDDDADFHLGQLAAELTALLESKSVH